MEEKIKKAVIEKIRAVFHLKEAKKLLPPFWRYKNIVSGIDSTGFCYIASEALFYMLGGLDSKYRPRRSPNNGEPHWWLESEDGEILDLTGDQYYPNSPPYHAAKKRSFLNGYSGPSKKCQRLMKLIREHSIINTLV